MINKRIEKLREKMREAGLSAYLVPTSDFHQSEYVGPYFKCREYITGFTGSAGTAVITKMCIRDRAGTKYISRADGVIFIFCSKQKNSL